MRQAAPSSSNKRSARAAAFAALWLSVLAALLPLWTASWTAGVSPAKSDFSNLSAANKRRLPILNLPLRLIAKFVAALIFLRAAPSLPTRAAPIHDHRRREHEPGAFRAMLRTALLNDMKDANGYSLARIINVVRNPERFIARVIKVIKRGLTRRRPIPPRAITEALASLFTPTPTHADTS